MQKIISLVVGISLFGFTVVPVQAAFSNLYVFGDSISTTTNNTSGLSFYYGQRYSNGRVWVEVLAQRQGLTYDPNKNWSYFYNSSTTMLANVSSFKAPLDASNALFVIWVNCADLWFPAMYSGTSMSQWTSAINQSQTNHYKAATNLYAKGARTLIMPNAVDVSTIPEFNAVRQRQLYSHGVPCLQRRFFQHLESDTGVVPQPDALYPGFFHPAHQPAGASRQLWLDQCPL